MLKTKKSWDLPLMAAVLILASACWTSCGSSGGGGGGGGGAPPTPPPPQLPTSGAGWTVHTPSVDSRLIYVSDSDGNDSDDGLSPATAKQTISAGKALLRTGFPDWLQLKAGDTFTDQELGQLTKSGRSETEPIVITAYGTGARPYIQTGLEVAFSMSGTVSHVALVGLRFHAHSFTGSNGSAGVLLLNTIDDLLFEDCVIEGYLTNFVIQANDGPDTITNFRIRRCIIVDAFSGTSSHSQGIYAEGLNGLLIEECVFDHNGWKEGGSGPATIFNHNIYLNACVNVVVRGSFFLRGSSMGNKFNCDFTGGSANILVEDNFYLEGEIGISIGGNGSDPFRFANVTIRDNVMMQIGRTQPTNRDLAWYLEVKDWDGGVVENNLFLHQTLLDNCFAIKMGGLSDRNVTLRTNLVYGLKGKGFEITMDGTESGILIEDNEIQDSNQGTEMIDHTGSFSPVTYEGNVYFSSLLLADWFRIDGDEQTHTTWVSTSGETGSSTGAATYPDPDRDETTYQTSLGGTPTLAAFIAELRAQSKDNWRPAYTAPVVNDYFRAGFGR